MKKSTINLILGIVLALILVIGGYKIIKYFKKEVPEGMIVVPQSTIDSLNAYVYLADSLKKLANLPPVIITDTVIVIKEPKYVETIPEKDSVSEIPLNLYKDELFVEDTISAWVEFKVRGYVEGMIKWGYKPIITEVTKVIKEPSPYPVIEKVKIPVQITGNYLSLTAGGNDKMFIFGVDYDIVKFNYIYGLQYRRFGQVNVYGIKAGINLNTIFNKIKNGS